MAGLSSAARASMDVSSRRRLSLHDDDGGARVIAMSTSTNEVTKVETNHRSRRPPEQSSVALSIDLSESDPISQLLEDSVPMRNSAGGTIIAVGTGVLSMLSVALLLSRVQGYALLPSRRLPSFSSSSSSRTIAASFFPSPSSRNRLHQIRSSLRLYANDDELSTGLVNGHHHRSSSKNGVVTDESWNDVLPTEDGSHRSARIRIPAVATAEEEGHGGDSFDANTFRERLENTVRACRERGKSSLWVEVPMTRCSLIETGHMSELGFQFHHAINETAVLNLWLRQDSESKVPVYATHHVGVGAVVVNSRNEILLVRELRRNYRPWKTPTGLSDTGESLDEAAVREVLEETGVPTTFHSVLSFRQTHGMAHGTSDLFFVCRLDPIERVDEETGKPIIPAPTAQACEIERAAWIPLDEYRKMVHDPVTGGHPMMKHVLEVFDAGRHIEKDVVQSVVPGRKPNAVYYPNKPTASPQE
jgi:ADP-ribose pyrophosphatase YjhB (NUDIX family)